MSSFSSVLTICVYYGKDELDWEVDANITPLKSVTSYFHIAIINPFL